LALLGVFLASTACAKDAKPAPKAEAAPAVKAEPVKSEPVKSEPRHVKVGVTQAGFEPAEISAKPNEALVLDITRVFADTCATEIVFKDLGIKQDLPMNQEVHVPVQAGKAGRIAFACAMNMIGGAIVVKE
jgi:plastocyanin domain-containing protein